MADDRPLKFTDSYLTSTISTTSGLGSNYTTHTSGSGSILPQTPSPRRKTSSTSFSEVAELQEAELNDNRAPMYAPEKYFDYRVPSNQYVNRKPNYSIDDSLPSNRNVGYFGKFDIGFSKKKVFQYFCFS